MKDIPADKQKNQQNAQQGEDQGGRLSDKPNGQPIHDDATQDLRNVAVKAPENSVEQPNKESRGHRKTVRPKQRNRRRPQRRASLSIQQQEQQGKKKKKPEDKPPDQ